MSRRRKGDHVNGIVLLDKPAGRSSNHVLQAVRRLFNARKAGHTGNLDPFATGMLPICLGEASKTAAFMLDADKTYLAEACFGAATSTGDPEGEVVEQAAVPDITPEAMADILQGFLGASEQVPPMFSALKHQGRPLYELAREGITVERQPRSIRIHDIELVGWQAPRLTFRVRCSKGTYIRTLAEDIAETLQSRAHLTALRRLSVSPFEEQGMVTLNELEQAAEEGALGEYLLPVQAGLKDWPEVELSAEAATRFANGNPVNSFARRSDTAREDRLVLVFSQEGHALGIALDDGEQVHPRRVFQNLGSFPGTT